MQPEIAVTSWALHSQCLGQASEYLIIKRFTHASYEREILFFCIFFRQYNKNLLYYLLIKKKLSLTVKLIMKFRISDHDVTLATVSLAEYGMLI